MQIEFNTLLSRMAQAKKNDDNVLVCKYLDFIVSTYKYMLTKSDGNSSWQFEELSKYVNEYEFERKKEIYDMVRENLDTKFSFYLIKNTSDENLIKYINIPYNQESL